MTKQYTLNPKNKWHQIVKAQFDDIREKGAIKKDSQRLWRPALEPGDTTTFPGLHRWTNEDWKDCFAEITINNDKVLKRVQQDSELWNTIELAWKAMERAELLGSKNHKRILDTKNYKPTQWKLMMMLRELYMDMNHITLKDLASEARRQDNSQFGKLFE